MKGYTNVYMHDAMKAISTWEEQQAIGKEIRDNAVDAMHHAEFVHGGWFTKVWHHHTSKIDFARSKMIGIFPQWSEVLRKYITDEQAEILDNWQWQGGCIGEYNAVKALVNGGYGDLLMDNELCDWINKQLGR